MNDAPIKGASPKESWKRMSFKGNKVWVQVDAQQNLLLTDGKVRIKYNLKQDYEYKVRPKNLGPEDAAVPAAKKTPGKKKKASSKAATATAEDVPDNCIKIYTDGASSGNPGPAGIGVLLIYKGKEKQISEYIGRTTNNVAELSAIKKALETLKRHDLPVRIFSDSSYSIGLLTKDWKAKKNPELVAEIRNLMKQFKNLRFVKVKGHAGIKENEVADYLATSAIKKGLG